MKKDTIYKDAIALLCNLIETPSYSREESKAVDMVEEYLSKKNIKIERYSNNICSYNLYYDEAKPTILINSHIDTVRPQTSYSRNPHTATIEDGKLYGLGSNDAGASLAVLIELFCSLYTKNDMRYNLALAISSEEEVSGKNGMELLVGKLRPISFAIVGEPTSMQMAVSERGLLVVDLTWHGVAGHAARMEGDNAIYRAVDDIRWVRDFKFEKHSQTLGATSMNLTVINSGAQHNVVPDKCCSVVDIRITDSYSFEEVLSIMRENLSCDIEPRSLRLRPSSINLDHPIVNAAKNHGIELFGSPTLSDQALMPFDSVKIGIGDSSRSHTADEYIYLNQIEEGINIYSKLLNSLL